MQLSATKITKLGLFDSRIKFPRGLETKPRPVKRYEIELYTEDQPGITYLNDREVPLKKGTLIVAKPGMLRHSRLPFKCLFLHVHVSEETLSKLMDRLPDVCMIADMDPITHQFHRIMSLDRETFPEEGLLMQSQGLALLYYLLQELGTNRSDMLSDHRKIMQATDRYIREHLTQSLDLQVLAKQANMSPSYFHKLFSRHFGSTPAEYVTNCRIVAAKTILATEDCSMEQVAERCGFSSQSYFNYRFKQQTGQTPNQYRAESLSQLPL